MSYISHVLVNTLFAFYTLINAQEIRVVKDCPTVAEVIHSYAALSELSKLLNETSLNKILNDQDLEITFFAPVNYAFVEHYTQTVQESAKTPLALEETMRMHMTPNPVTLMELESGQNFKTNSTLGSEVKLTVDFSDVDMLVLSGGSISAIVDGDVVACKSIIHFVNSVLVLPRPILLILETLESGLLGGLSLP